MKNFKKYKIIDLSGSLPYSDEAKNLAFDEKRQSTVYAYKIILFVLIFFSLFKDSVLDYKQNNFDALYLGRFIFILLLGVMKIFNWTKNIRIGIIILLSVSAVIEPLNVLYSMLFLDSEVWKETVKEIGLLGALLPLGVITLASFLFIVCLLILGRSDIRELLLKRGAEACQCRKSIGKTECS